MHLTNQTNCNPTSINNTLLFNFQQKPQYHSTKKTIIENTIDRVCKVRGLTRDKVMVKCKKRVLTETRQIIAYILKHDTRMKLKLDEIAEVLSLRDHSSALYSINVMQSLIDTDKFFKAQVTDLQRIIYNY